MQCDHKSPLVPVETTLEAMSWDEVVNRTWCAPENLQSICVSCHKIKSKAENKLRREYKKSLQKSDKCAILPEANKQSQPKNKRKIK